LNAALLRNGKDATWLASALGVSEARASDLLGARGSTTDAELERIRALLAARLSN
jgi:plasmid maintenance system antidote protein VapI